MPYTKGASNATGPYAAGGTQTYQQANNAEYQYDEATQSFERDLFNPFVFSGLTATKDGTTASQLDVASGVAFLRQADNTLRRQAPTSSTQSTAGHPSTTMYLFLQTDGTWAWQTSSTGPTNSLAVAHVTTDGSSNILTVVDDRVINTTLLSGMLGAPAVPGAFYWNGTTGPHLAYYSGANATQIWTPQTGVAQWLELVIWNGTTTKVPLGIGSAAAGLSLAYVDDSGTVHDAAGVAAVTIAGAAWATQAKMGVGPIGNRPAAGVKGRVYIETPFS